MIDINKYIIEKLHLNKDTEPRCNDLMSWLEYIETIGGAVVEMSIGVYIICLGKSANLVYDITTKVEYTYPYIEIETIDDDNKAWEPYDREDGQMIIHKDNKVKEKYSEKELEKFPHSWRKNVYKFNEKNAEFIIDKLNELYE